MPVIPVNKVVDPKRIIAESGGPRRWTSAENPLPLFPKCAPY
jgi:hypothetical protein